MSLTSSDITILVVGIALTFMTVILVIWEAERQMYMFGIRPSESVATDIGGFITLSRGIVGKEVVISYTPQLTENVIYNVTIKDKTVCVTSYSRYTITDCASTAFNVPGGIKRVRDVGTFTLKIEKKLPDLSINFVS